MTERKIVGLSEPTIDLLKTIVGQTKNGVTVKDTTGRYVMLNPAAAEILGVNAADVLGKTAADLLAPDTAEKIMESDAETIRTGQSRTLEETIVVKGKERVLESAKIVHAGANGQPAALISIYRDITERRRVDEIMRNLAVRFASSFGTDFFNAVCAHVADVLSADYVFVGRLMGDARKVKVVAGIGQGEALEPFEYSLKGTPCEEVIGKQACVYKSGTCALFPDDDLLAKMNIDGYVGIPLYTRAGGPLGIFVTLSTVPITDTRLAVSMMTGYSERVSAEIERSEAEDALRSSEERFSKAFRHASDALAITSLDNMKLVDVNEGFEELTGFTREEAIGKSTHELRLWADAAERQAFLKALEDEREVQEMEATFKTKNGEERTIIFSSRIMDLAGRPHSITVARDITRHKQAEQALKESEGKYRSLFENANDAIFLIDAKTQKIIDCNEQAAQMEGYSLEELRKMSIRDLHPKDEWPLIPEKLKAITEEGRVTGITGMSHLTKDGRLLPTEINARRIELGGRQINFAIIRDLTERAQAEEALHQKDRDIRKAYADVFSAVTDDKLLILTPDEIEAAPGEPISDAYTVTSLEHLADSREFIRNALAPRGLDEEALKNMVLASGEAVTNGVKHSGSCDVQLYSFEDAIQIRITDHGSGIDFTDLPKATLLPGFSTKKSLGMGFALILSICDRVLLSTGPSGTTLILESGGHKAEESLDDILNKGMFKDEAV